jgi:hypothetical protein
MGRNANPQAVKLAKEIWEKTYQIDGHSLFPKQIAKLVKEQIGIGIGDKTIRRLIEDWELERRKPEILPAVANKQYNKDEFSLQDEWKRIRQAKEILTRRMVEVAETIHPEGINDALIKMDLYEKNLLERMGTLEVDNEIIFEIEIKRPKAGNE